VEEKNILEKVKVENNMISLKINPAFYDGEIVSTVKNDFKKLSQIFVKKKEDLISVTLIPKEKLSKEEMKIFGYEFYNHLLNAIKELRGE